MKKTKAPRRILQPPLAAGQLWRMAGAELRVASIGKLLVHYKLVKPNAVREKKETDAMIPAGVRLGRPLWILNHRLRRILHGHFSLKKTSYAIYTKASPGRRLTMDVPHPTAIWWSRL